MSRAAGGQVKSNLVRHSRESGNHCFKYNVIENADSRFRGNDEFWRKQSYLKELCANAALQLQWKSIAR